MNKKNNVTIMSFFVAALVGGLLLFIAGNASASLTLDYTLDSSNPLASISYNTSSGILSGSNIAVTAITGIGTSPTGSLAITGGVLSFATNSIPTINGNTWIFPSEGTITVTGGVTPLSLPATTTLLSGAFSSFSVTQSVFGTFVVASASGTLNSVVGNPSVNTYFNIPSASTSAVDISLVFLATSNNNVQSLSLQSISIGNGSILDTATPNFGGVPTPIPAAAWLFGSGMMGLAGLRSRRFSKA